jgi:O-methyltransferase
MTLSFEKISFSGGVFNVRDAELFKKGCELIKQSLHSESLYIADNLITWNRNLSFLREKKFQEIVASDSFSQIEKSIIWRTYVLLYLAEFSSNTFGDFMEIGCLTGHTAQIISDNVNMLSLKKKYFLYDLFDKEALAPFNLLPGHENPNMFHETVARFAEKKYVKVVKGFAPESFEIASPDKVAFCHIDLNNAESEAACLRWVLPRLSKGGSVVFDDYGWLGYSAQKQALDPIAAEFGFKILEIPTGQGILLKP